MNRNAIMLWSALFLAVIFGAVWEMQKLPDASSRIALLPMRGLMVDSRDMPLTPSEEIAFNGSAWLKRLAMAGREQVILTVLDGTRNRHAVHDPVFCFRGAGWEVERQEPFLLRHGEGCLVKLRRGETRAEALYWFSDGDIQFASPMLYWGKTSLRRLSFGSSGGEPILVILTSTLQGSTDWKSFLLAWPELEQL
jgi:hypothetical protein